MVLSMGIIFGGNEEEAVGISNDQASRQPGCMLIGFYQSWR
jgi:hypothetical protein